MTEPAFPAWLEEVARRRGLRPSFCRMVLKAASGARVEPRSALALEYVAGDGQLTGRGQKLADELLRAKKATRPSTLKATDPEAEFRAMLDELFGGAKA